MSFSLQHLVVTYISIHKAYEMFVRDKGIGNSLVISQEQRAREADDYCFSCCVYEWVWSE